MINLYNLAVIHKMPTTTDELQEINFLAVGRNTHESCFRSYHILQTIKQMLKDNEPRETIITAIELMENGFK